MLASACAVHSEGAWHAVLSWQQQCAHVVQCTRCRHAVEVIELFDILCDISNNCFPS